MGGKSSRAPAPPDPNVVSAAQTRSNQDTASYNNAISHGNTTTPYGSQTFTGRRDPVTGATVYDQNISLSPDQQALLDLNNAGALNLGQTASGLLDRVRGAYAQPMDTSGVPSLQTSPDMQRVAPGQYQTNAGQTDQLSVNGPGIQGTLSTDGLAELYGAADLEGVRRQTQDALYGRQAAYLDPQWQRREEGTRTRAANMGIVEGSEAWNNLMDAEGRARSFDYGQARDSAITGGGAEMARLAGIASQNRGQQFGERQAQGNFQNSAQAQALAEALATAGFGNNARLTNANFANSATGAANSDALAAAGANNQSSLAAANFDNNARAQGLEQLYALRNQPLNEYNALSSGAQVNAPNFQNPQNSFTQPTDVAGNINQNYNQRMNIWNAQQQQQNNLFSGLFGLGSAALMSPTVFASDERLKTDIEQVGELPQGVGVYDYEYRDEPGKTYTGVMAQEVEQVQPDAVSIGANGFKQVDYSRVLAEALRRVA